MTALAQLAHYNNYSPDSFGWPRGGPLVPLQVNGVNFGECARDAHDLLVTFLTELATHIDGGLRAGSCWAYSATDDLPDGSWSFHHYGIAVDVNWNVNHMGTNIPDATGKWAVPRGTATALALKYGLEWGGNWNGGFHDDMHFEIHLTPAIARNFRQYIPTVPATEGFVMDPEVKAAFAAINARLDALPAKVWQQPINYPDPATGKPVTLSAAHWLAYAANRIGRVFSRKV